MNTLDKHGVPVCSLLVRIQVDRVWEERDNIADFDNEHRHTTYLQRRERFDER